MRTIRLRVWHKRSATMYYLVEHTSYPDGSAGVSLIGDPSGRLFAPDDSEVEVMQWTGLYDQRGKPIWEGDIVLHQTQPFTPIMKGIIYWEDASFYFRQIEPAPSHGDKWVIYKPANEHIEVIGNIYEHADLLKPSGDEP